MILLDTHTLIWWINNSPELSKKALAAIQHEKEKGLILVSSFSVWEIFLLVQKNRLSLSMDIDSWIKKLESLSYVQFVPVDNIIASKSVQLPGEFHQDPADRIIIATARENGAVLITSDKRIRKYSFVHSLW